MFNNILSIQNLLWGTFLEQAKIISLEVPESDKFVFAININQENYLQAWQLFKNQLNETERYPIVTTSWGGGYANWEQNIRSGDLFSRFYFREEYPNLDVAPEAIIERTNLFNQADLEQFLNVSAVSYTDDLEEQILPELETTEENFGSAPTEKEIREQIKLNKISTIVDLERYLFNWELNCPNQEEFSHYSDYMDWCQPNNQHIALLLLPTPHSWETLAYLSWYGGSKIAIPLLRQWYQKYQAELVCHYGTMLQLNVSKKPTTLTTAFELAWQQIALAPCTTMLPGISIREHARCLLQTNRWFLHERP
jgi:hypothetical protein